MALEASDLNDGTILQQTKQNTDARGNIQFEITLPSGRVLKSEFLNKDNARKALFAWIETVKEQAVADSNVERLERAAKAKRAAGKMDIERRPGDAQPLFRAGGARVEPEKPDAGYVPDYVDQSQPEVPTGTVEEFREKVINDLQMTRVPAGDTVKAALVAPPVEPLEFAKAQHDIQAKRVAELKDAERKLWQWTVIIETLEEKSE